MKVLLIDNTFDADCWGSAELRRFVTGSKDRTVFTRRGPHADLPKSVRGFDRVILSGSRASCLDTGAWVSALDSLLRDALSGSTPVLGVCYGHQALNRVLGGTAVLGRSPTPEFGWTEIEVLERDPLFSGLGDRFWTFSSHWEEVTALPKGMRLLAKSRNCAIQACRLEDRPVYGIQFHPEKNLAETDRSIAGWRKDERKNMILGEKSGKKLYDPKVGETLFSNFLKGGT